MHTTSRLALMTGCGPTAGMTRQPFVANDAPRPLPPPTRRRPGWALCRPTEEQRSTGRCWPACWPQPRRPHRYNKLTTTRRPRDERQCRSQPRPPSPLTDNAAGCATQLLAQEGDDQLALRVAVRAGGCSGFSYEIFFDADTDPEDHEAVFGTVKVRVDPASAPHIAGATLDYKDGLQGAGFHIENPNAQRSCGCGQSFA